MMITTSIQLVGLLVTLMLDPRNPDAGVRVVMGDFSDAKPVQTRLIAWPQGSRVILPPPDINWPCPTDPCPTFTTSGGTVYEYVLVDRYQDVSMSGITDRFTNLMGPIPHLTCCCTQFDS